MKQINMMKLLCGALLCAAGTTNGQQIIQHPFAFPATAAFPYSNYYADYVGLRLDVTSPASVAGDKIHTTANDNNPGNTNNWGSFPSTPIINLPISMPQAGDSLAASAITTDMTGKIALIYRGGGVYFGDKAYAAQQANAVACIIVNNVPGNPIGMAVGGMGSSVTIPVFMITKSDGDALDALYNESIIPHVTITTWGQHFANDLGFIPQGLSYWQNYATPSNQVVSSGNPVPYQAIDGGFIANYGTNAITNVKLSTSVNFFPTSGPSVFLHSDTIKLTTPFDNSNPAADSVWALYGSLYNLSGITGNGHVTVNYAITSDSTDNNPTDDTASLSYYFTDSLYSKGKYDFANNRPVASLYEGLSVAAGDGYYLWGNMYYVNKGGSAASTVQWSMSSNTDTAGPIASLPTMTVYVFKWVDGMNSEPVDSLVQNGELELVGAGLKDFTGSLPQDTSGGFFSAAILDSNATGNQPLLDASSWYYVAMEMPGETADEWFLGCDGGSNTYPRAYAKWENNQIEYTSPVWAGDRGTGNNAQIDNFDASLTPVPFGGSFFVDSVVFSQEKGLVPAVPLIVNKTPTTHISSVKQAFAQFDLYPNPATEYINVSLGLDNPAKSVTYTIISASARVVSKVTHHNVQNEIYTYGTTRLPSGNYFMVVAADGKQMFKKFTVLR